MRPFLTADWLWLTGITYAVDPSVLAPYLPKGLELDVIDGKAFVSIVPFSFCNTRVRGLRFPFHSDFPELNLRFYVRHKQRRGVVFIREYVPRFMVAFIANTLYSEQYRTAKMKNSIVVSSSQIDVRYELSLAGRNFSIEVKAQNAPYIPSSDSTEHYFKEQEFGFSSAPGSIRMYRVDHPVWKAYPVVDIKLDLDTGFLFGSAWDFLRDEVPYNVMFLEGSPVKVFPHFPVV